jgi:hypothetical protein
VSFLCGGTTAPTADGEWPDTGLDAPCCEDSAYDGPGSCICWQPVYDLEQQPINDEIARMLDAGVLPVTRPLMCGDCAYRPGSPEKSGDETFAGDADFLDQLAADEKPFWCHQGIRVPVTWRHPSGMEIPGHAGGYDPPIRKGVPYQADGQPAHLCAGWDARRRALAARTPPPTHPSTEESSQ